MTRTPHSLIASVLLIVAGAAQASSTVDFSNGDGGWEGINPTEPIPGFGTWIDPTLGHTAPALHSVIPDSFVLHWQNTTSAVTGSFSQPGSVTIGLDVNANSIINLFTGEEVSRDLVVELRDYDSGVNGIPYSSVWFNLGTLAAGNGWQHLSATIGDTTSATLPSGWNGYGDWNADGTGTLPAGVSFADILKGVDEVAFTTAVPDWMYGYTYFDVALDNVSISAVPEPTTVVLQGLGLAALAGIVRRKRQAR